MAEQMIFSPDDENGAKAKKKTAAPRHDLPHFFRVSLLRTDGRALRTA